MLTCMGNLLSSTEERVYFKDLQSRFLLVSAGWMAAYSPGHDRADLIGKTDFDVFSDAHASAAFADEQRIIRTGEPMTGKVERETYQGRPDAWVQTTKMPLRDERGAIIGTFGISRDITRQVRAEKEIALQAMQLRTQNERLLELDRLKDEFIGLVSHELRTPLTSIVGYIELLRDEPGAGSETGHFAEVIERNAQRLQRLVEDLLFVSGLQSGRITMDLRDEDLAGLTAAAVEEMQPAAQSRRIDLVLAADSVPRFPLDPTRIAQLLGNLISNAVKFTPDGGRIEVSLRTDADHAVLAVADDGTGIPAADREWVFERFYRTATATQQAVPGTGLGLTIAKSIVAAHHGTIRVDGNPGGGSTFTVCLPVRPPP